MRFYNRIKSSQNCLEVKNKNNLIYSFGFSIIENLSLTTNKLNVE